MGGGVWRECEFTNLIYLYIQLFIIHWSGKAMAKTEVTNIAVGKNKGHPTTKIQLKKRPAHAKGKLGKRTKAIRQVISEVSGVSSYEKRIVELLKAGSMKDTKKALKVAKKALGTHRRAKVKRENLMNLIRAQQKKKWLTIYIRFLAFYL